MFRGCLYKQPSESNVVQPPQRHSLSTKWSRLPDHHMHNHSASLFWKISFCNYLYMGSHGIYALKPPIPLPPIKRKKAWPERARGRREARPPPASRERRTPLVAQRESFHPLHPQIKSRPRRSARGTHRSADGASHSGRRGCPGTPCRCS